MAASSGLFRNKSEQGGQPIQVVSPLASKMAASSGLFRKKSEQCGQPTQVGSPLASMMAASSGLFRNKSEQCGQPTQVGRPLAARGSPVAPGRSTVNKSAAVTSSHSQRSIDPSRYLPVSGDSVVFIQLNEAEFMGMC